MERYCVNLVLSWNILISPSMVIESFAGCSSLGWNLCSLNVCITSAQALLAFIVSGEKSGVILILLWNTLVSPSMLIESLTGYSSLAWHWCSLSVCITSIQDLPADQKGLVTLVRP